MLNTPKKIKDASRRALLYSLALLLCAGVLLSSPNAKADPITYTYTGNLFTNFGGGLSCTNGVGECQITGSFTLAAPLAANLSGATITPVSFSFTDGVQTHTITQANPQIPIAFSNFGTDSLGNITHWTISLNANGVSLFTENFSLTQSDETSLGTSGTIFAYNLGSPGTWSPVNVAPVPEPGSLLLLGTGLLGLVGAVRRKWLT